MAKYKKTLALALASVAVGNGADADGDGWVDIPSGATDATVTLDAYDTANLTALVEVEDVHGVAFTIHTEVFAANGQKGVYLGRTSPFSKVRVRNSAFSGGELNAGLNYNL